MTTEPMLAKAAEVLPEGEGWLFEPKWDGFRCIVVRDGDSVELTSRGSRPFTRYFPELLDPLREQLPERCAVDGELLVVGGDALDFDALQQRIHPAESRVRMLAETTPARFVAFDLLALDGEDLLATPFVERRQQLRGGCWPTPLRRCTSRRSPTTSRRRATGSPDSRAPASTASWPSAPRAQYEPGKRGWVKVKHQRTADMVVAGFRWHKDGAGVGSLMLGLYDDAGNLNSDRRCVELHREAARGARRGAGAAARERAGGASLG